MQKFMIAIVPLPRLAAQHCSGAHFLVQLLFLNRLPLRHLSLRGLSRWAIGIASIAVGGILQMETAAAQQTSRLVPVRVEDRTVKQASFAELMAAEMAARASVAQSRRETPPGETTPDIFEVLPPPGAAAKTQQAPAENQQPSREQARGPDAVAPPRGQTTAPPQSPQPTAPQATYDAWQPTRQPSPHLVLREHAAPQPAPRYLHGRRVLDMSPEGKHRRQLEQLHDSLDHLHPQRSEVRGQRAAMPAARTQLLQKTPYSYGYFGATPRHHWSLHFGTRQKAKRWTRR